MQGFGNAPWQCGGASAREEATLGCVGHHCCVLSAPPSTPSPPLLFFGMTEAYDASVCLFWYQTGQYTAANWLQSSCTCSQRAALHHGLKRFEFPWTRTQGTEAADGREPDGSSTHSSTPEFSISRDEIERLNPGDMIFHRAAWREFERRVTIVEDRVGHNFLHCGADSTSPTQHRRGARSKKKN